VAFDVQLRDPGAGSFDVALTCGLTLSLSDTTTASDSRTFAVGLA
jgi:hypothetical protein